MRKRKEKKKFTVIIIYECEYVTYNYVDGTSTFKDLLAPATPCLLRFTYNVNATRLIGVHSVNY